MAAPSRPSKAPTYPTIYCPAGRSSYRPTYPAPRINYTFSSRNSRASKRHR
jgi:hypothetical protein